MTQCEIDDAGIATLDLHALATSHGTTEAMLQAFQACIEWVGSAANVTGLVIAYDGSSFAPFASRPKLLATLSPTEMLASISRLGDLFRRVETCGKPVVAALFGGVTDEALELALACHYRVVENRTDAAFGFPNAPAGRFPAAGATQRLPRLLGIEKALPLLQGRKFTATQGLTLGLFDISAEAGSVVRQAKQAIWDGNAKSTAAWDRKGFEFPGISPTGLAALDSFTKWNAVALAARDRQPAAIALLSSVFEGVRLPISRALRVEQKLCVDVARRQGAQI